MPDKIFLRGYSGQSLDELLALEPTHRIDSLVLAIESAIQRKGERDSHTALTPEETTVLAVEALEREVNNGGFHQFFLNSSVEFAPVVVDALKRIGCPKFAEIAHDAIAVLQLKKASPDAIRQAMEQDDDHRDKSLSACDSRFFKYPEQIEDQLFAFIKAARNRISF